MKPCATWCGRGRRRAGYCPRHASICKASCCATTSAIAGAAGQAPAVEWVCTGPIAYRGEEALKRDIDNLKEALSGVPHVEAFMPAVSPTQLANWNKNEYYAS